MSGDTNQLDTSIDQALVTSVPDKSSLLPRPGETWNSQCSQLLEEKKISELLQHEWLEMHNHNPTLPCPGEPIKRNHLQITKV